MGESYPSVHRHNTAFCSDNAIGGSSFPCNLVTASISTTNEGVEMSLRRVSPWTHPLPKIKSPTKVKWSGMWPLKLQNIVLVFAMASDLPTLWEMNELDLIVYCVRSHFADLPTSLGNGYVAANHSPFYSSLVLASYRIHLAYSELNSCPALPTRSQPSLSPTRSISTPPLSVSPPTGA